MGAAYTFKTGYVFTRLHGVVSLRIEILLGCVNNWVLHSYTVTLTLYVCERVCVHVFVNFPYTKRKLFVRRIFH
jgi:hypothetical protein